MEGLLSALVALAPVIVEVVPLLLKWLFGDATAMDRARVIQDEVRQEALLMDGRNEDELSRREKTRMAVLDMALRMRGRKSSK